jgi:hypothetical protein
MKEIVFYPSSMMAEAAIPYPKPALNYLPEWYKQMKMFGGEGNKPIYHDGTIANKTVKACMPFMDSLVSGYIQESWCDLHISFDNDGYFEYNYSCAPSPISYRDSVSISVPNIFVQKEFVWQVHWAPKLEKGYSALITHPFNRFDLPFINTSGIIDSDEFFHEIPGNYPFYFYKNDEVFIPAGTPLYQIIPIKRDSWQSSAEKFDEFETVRRRSEAMRFFQGTYKKFFHQKKSYR